MFGCRCNLTMGKFLSLLKSQNINRVPGYEHANVFWSSLTSIESSQDPLCNQSCISFSFCALVMVNI